MNRLLIVFVLLVASVVALGFYQGWFRVDQDKIQQDEEKAKEKVQDLGQKVKEKVSTPASSAREEGSKP